MQTSRSSIAGTIFRHPTPAVASPVLRNRLDTSEGRSGDPLMFESYPTRFRVSRLAGLASATVAVAAVRAGLRYVPLPRLSQWLGVRIGTERGQASAPPSWADLPLTTADKLQNVDAILARWPAPSPCLTRALACGFLLREEHPTLRIGAPKLEPGSPWAAHAWLDVGEATLPEPRSASIALSGMQRLGRL